MSFRLLGYTPSHWRNGTTAFGKAVCWAVGEKKYDSARVFKRTALAEVYYLKQTVLHWIFVNKNDWANFFAILPKTDSSHGFPWKETQSRYAQFAEDTINSDGYMGWYTYLWVGAAAVWSFLFYFWPRRWLESYDLLSVYNAERIQYIDGVMNAGYDNTGTYWWGFYKIIFSPHEYKRWVDDRFASFAPDSRTQPACITLNRQNTYYDHHWRGVGYETEMG
jgi:hypothetical protein